MRRESRTDSRRISAVTCIVILREVECRRGDAISSKIVGSLEKGNANIYIYLSVRVEPFDFSIQWREGNIVYIFKNCLKVIICPFVE